VGALQQPAAVLTSVLNAPSQTITAALKHRAESKDDKPEPSEPSQ